MDVAALIARPGRQWRLVGPRKVLCGSEAVLYSPLIMSNLTIEVWDATGNKKQLVEVPGDAPVNRLIAVLVEKMNLPRQSPDGQLMSYKFHHKSSGRQLLDTQTLLSADVRQGDVLRLQPEITAGSR
jgi:WXG100 protein secretion system (Wss), protein YukD